MSGQKGRDVLIKIGDGDDPEAFVTVAGIRAKTISLNARTVDGTSGESPSGLHRLQGRNPVARALSIVSCSVTFFGLAVRDGHEGRQ